MFLELLVGYWALKPIAEEIDRISYEQEADLFEIEEVEDEIEDLKEEIKKLKS